MLISAKFASTSSSTLFTLTFDETITLSNYFIQGIQTDSLGFFDINMSSISLDITGKILTFTTPLVLSTTENVSMFVTDTATYEEYNIIVGGSGNNIIVGTDSNGYIYANEGADIIDGEYGSDTIILTEATAAVDTVVIKDWTSHTHGSEDVIYGFDVSGTTTNDKLNMASNNIAAAAAIADGLDVGTIAKHTIGAGGIVSFQTSTGTNIAINTPMLVDNAIAYLEKNIATSGTTMAFRYDMNTDGTNDGLMIFQNGVGSGNHDTGVFLEGIGATATLTTTATAAANNLVRIEDTTGPEIMDAETTTSGLKFTANEKVQTSLSSFAGVSLLKNGTTAMGTVTVAYDATATIATLSTATTLLTTDYVEIKLNPTIASYLTDLSGNKRGITFEEGGVVIGGTGNNTINLSTKTVNYALIGGAGDDSMTGTAYSDYLSGGIGNDVLNGGNGNDELEGDDGNDTLNGGAGYDNMEGGLGNDTYIVSGYDYVHEDAGSGTDLVKSYDYYYSLTENVENLQLMRSGISGYGNDLNNIIYAGKGGNSINGGYAGNDTLSYQYASASVNANLSTSTATVSGLMSDSITNIDNLTGSNYADTLTGDGNANVLNGGLLGDTMAGGLGNDTYYVDNTADVVTEAASSGTDTLISTITITTLATNVENLTLSGTSLINGTGNTLNNVLSGNGVANTLNGGAGNDTINGGLGNDTLTGGTGLDTFVFNTAFNAATNVDTITDFVAADDTIKLENAIFIKLTTLGTLAAGNISFTGAPTDTNDYILYNASTGILSYDADGSGTVSAAIQIALLGTTTHPTLSAADFVVI